MKTINLEDVKNIVFSTENCEYINVPKESFKKLIITQVTSEFFEFDSIIENKNLSYSSVSSSYTSPFDRLLLYDDIDYIKIILNNDEEVSGKVAWYDSQEEFNKYQTSKFISNSEDNNHYISLSIKKSNLVHSLDEVFTLKSGTVIIDENNNEYTLSIINNKKTIPNVNITKDFINSKFKIKE